MTTEDPPEYKSVEILRLMPGDRIVVKTPTMSAESTQRLRDSLQAHFPGHMVIVLDESMGLQIIRETDAPEE